MELIFNGGKFVSLEGELNYHAVLDDFPAAKTIRILTYNISKNQKQDLLLDALRDTQADVQLITNVPSRMERYYNSEAGQRMRSAAKSNIQIYISKLNPENFSDNFFPFFNVHNHAKIIGTENIVYIGSANYSNESADNIETGVLIEDKDFIQRLYASFFDKVKEESLSYFDETFSSFRLFILSLHAKFTYHHRKLLTDLYTDYERTENVVSETVLLDVSDLDLLYRDIDELERVFSVADDIYEEENENYNNALEELKGQFNAISTEWLKTVVSEEGSLYSLVNYSIGNKAEEILQTDFIADAYDENLDDYAQQAINISGEIYHSLHEAFVEDSDCFLEEIEKILSALVAAMRFTEEWKTAKVNPQIDNT